MRPREDGSTPLAVTKKSLTDFFVKNLKPADRVTKVYDLKQRGLVVQMQRSGAASYKVYWSQHGRPRWFHIGRTDAIGLAEARKVAAQIMLKVALGEDPQAQRTAQRAAGTFRELVEAYLAESTNKSRWQYERQLRSHALPLWGSMPAGSITRDDVETLFNRRKRASISTAKLLLASISAVYSFGLNDPRFRSNVLANPCLGMGSAKRDKSLRKIHRSRVLTDAEIVPFWDAWVQGGPLRCLALRLLLLTGQRPGEICSMQSEHIDIGEHNFDRITRDGNIHHERHDGAWWSLPGQPDGAWPGTKNGGNHRVWLTPLALTIAQEFLDVRGTSPGYLSDELSALMRRVSDALGVDRARPHDLRRTHGTLVTRLGFSRDAMNRIQNHREGGIGSVYDQNEYADEARRVQAAITARIERLLSGDAGNVVEFKVA
jgi:integrase